MKQFFVILIFASAVIGFFACKKDNSLEQLRKNELAKLAEYIGINYPDSLPKSSGLYYIEEIEGHGDSLIRGGDRVQIFYATWTIDSILIDQSQDYLQGGRYEPLEFIVGAGSVVAGLDEAATYMREGGKAHLVLPSEVAYGQNGSGTVGGFTTLLMEVEMYKVYPIVTP